MKRLFLLVFLLLVGVIWGATQNVYVDDRAPDDTTYNGTTTWALKNGANGPYKTIKKAVDTNIGGAGDTVNINVFGQAGGTTYTSTTYLLFDTGNSGQYWVVKKDATSLGTVTFTSSDVNESIWFASTMATGTVTFDGVNLAPANTQANGITTASGNSAVNITFQNLSVTAADNQPYGFFLIGAGTDTAHTITFSNFQYTATTNQTCGFADIATMGGFYITNGSNINITYSTANSAMFQLTGAITNMFIKDSTITSTATGAGSGTLFNNKSGTWTFTTWDMRRNIFSSNGFSQLSTGTTVTAGTAIIENNIVTVTGGAGNCVHFGIEPGSAGTSFTFIRCADNTITKSGGSGGHALFLGLNVVNGVCVNNKVIGLAGDFTGVFKCKNVSVLRNIFKGGRPILLSYGGGNTIANNTCYSTGTNSEGALQINDNTLGDAPKYSIANYLINNIFDASGATNGYAFNMSGSGPVSQRMDYNCYRAGPSGLGVINGHTLTTTASVSDIITEWVGFTGADSLNDVHSIVTNPQFRNAAAGDFVPLNNLLLYSGKPDSDGRNTYLGALNPKVGQPFDRRRWWLSNQTLGGHW